MKKVSAMIAVLMLFCTTTHAYRLEENQVRSERMDKDVPVNVITPDAYAEGVPMPVIYLLHGFSDNYRSWSQRGVVGSLADRYGIIFVMPDGGYDSWYFDSELTPEYQYETFVSKELVEYIDSRYTTVKGRNGRAITGLSMGGHGALYLGIRHQDTFGSMGAMSGGVDIRPFPNDWGIWKRLGKQDEHPENWEKNTVINMTHLLQPGAMNIIVDCGTEDFFFEVNCALHEKLLDGKIPHEFYTRPGHHNWDYWMNAIKYQVLYFNDCFRR
jgi:S-formylglutathione hydrolase FrmB